jgi:hypothetical protein
MSRADGPFNILEKINDNAYKLELPPELKMRFYRGQCQFKRGEVDEDITTLDTTTPFIEVQGPITRSWAQWPNCQVNSFLCSSDNDLEIISLPNDLIVIRNQGVDHGGYVGHQEGDEEPRKLAQQGGDPI